MKVAFCLFFTLALFCLYSDAIEEEGKPVDCTGYHNSACTKSTNPIVPLMVSLIPTDAFSAMHLLKVVE
ncbi:hypothetical protein E2320_015300 [Naja naja]|nr:hypothetical protein E2320_015300 [Naja naja]